MQGLVKIAAVTVPAALIMIYIWGGQSNKMEARQAVESAAFNRDWEEAQADFATDPAAKARHLARAATAQSQLSTAKLKTRAAEAKADRIAEEVETAIRTADRELTDQKP